MSTKPPLTKRSTSLPPTQDVIVIQRLITIGEVQASANGHRPMVEEAFAVAGAFLNSEAAQGESNAVQFTYLGVTFYASCVVPEDINQPIPRPDIDY